MMVRSQRLQPYSPAGARSRIFVAPGLRTDGVSADVHLGVLPLSRFLNGHTYFVQHAHQLPGAPPPLSVHMTYQFAEGAKFAYGKRQRLREAGLWMVEEPSYYNGRYLTVSQEAATLPFKPMDRNVDSREAVKYHLAEARHRASVLRPLLGIAKALGRALILPRMLCYCDFMWKEVRACACFMCTCMRMCMCTCTCMRMCMCTCTCMRYCDFMWKEARVPPIAPCLASHRDAFPQPPSVSPPPRVAR